MDQLYKPYPPHLGHLKLPVVPRAATLAGMGLYSPCRSGAEWLHRGARLLVKLLGQRGIPGRAAPWTPPLPPREWLALRRAWREAVGEFDDLAVHERAQPDRSGLSLLLIREGAAIGFVRVERGAPDRLCKEYRVLASVHRSGPHAFSAPEPLHLGRRAEWAYVVTTAMPTGSHRMPRNPPVRLIGREIALALAGLPAPAGVPAHWEPMHGDLTPWNLRELAGRGLFLVDWEDAGWGPPGADAVLYEATASALESRPARWTGPGETVDFWRERLSRRADGAARDRRLADATDARLRAMRQPGRSRPRGDERLPEDESPRARALVFAYACEPSCGSEPGAGWAVTSALARRADCVVLVGSEHAAALRAWQAGRPREGIEFVSIPGPRWARWAGRHRIGRFLTYLAWLRRAGRVARRRAGRERFDFAAHVTYSVYWLPTPASRLGLPLLWGPVGGAVRTPLRCWPGLGWRGLFGEVLDLLAVRTAAWLPATRRTWRGVDVAWVQNRSTLERLPRWLRERAVEVSHVEFEPRLPEDAATGDAPTPSRPFILFVGALQARKGCVLAVDAMRYVPASVGLVVAGDGPERARLERRARRLGVEDRVIFAGRLDRDDLFAVMRAAAAAVVPWLREEGGMALGELMRVGVPVVVLAHGGPLRVSDSAIDPRRVRLVAPGGCRDTARRLGRELAATIERPAAGRGPTLGSEVASAALDEALGRVLGKRSGP